MNNPIPGVAPTKKPPRLLYVEFYVVSVIPPLLAYGIGVTNYTNVTVLAIVFLLVIFLVSLRIMRKAWTLEDIGLTSKTFTKKVISIYLSAILLGIAWFIAIGYFTPSKWVWNMKVILLYSFFGSFAQEFLYRGYLLKLGTVLFGASRLNFFLNVVLFTGMHSIFPNGGEKMLFVLPGALLLTWLYQKYPNLLLISGVHVVFNGIAIMERVFN